MIRTYFFLQTPLIWPMGSADGTANRKEMEEQTENNNLSLKLRAYFFMYD